ncbi:yippee zinc-binding/DNA-binding /Mis18, centromere assembly-domain-containing protein [Aspergillus recurvatus]
MIHILMDPLRCRPPSFSVLTVSRQITQPDLGTNAESLVSLVIPVVFIFGVSFDGDNDFLMFPKFLLPPPIFQAKKRNEGSSGSLSLASELPNDVTSGKKYLQGHISCIRCSTCAAELCLTSQIVSKGFTGRHGRAYLVSAESTVTAPSDQGDSLPNTLLQSPVSRNLVTGAHTVSDIECVLCRSVLGWKYIKAEEQSQKYKVGKFILETNKIIKTSAWDPAFGANLTRSTGIEFDSQDEDECEDLFSGVWNPGLAVRRRSRIARRASTLGI